MARVPLVDEGLPQLAELIARLRSGRRGSLINVYRLLLHSPPLAATWFEHLNAVRWQTGLDGRLREIVIIRIALLNRVPYVVNQHVPKLALAEGLSEVECSALANWQASGLFSERERAVLAYTDAVTKDVQAPDSVFAEVARHFDHRQLVELTVLIGTYNMHTRVLGALQIDPEPAPT